MSDKKPRQERLKASRVRRFRPTQAASWRRRRPSTRPASCPRLSRVVTSFWDSLEALLMTRMSPEEAGEAAEAAEAAEVVVLPPKVPLEREATPRRLSKG